MYCLLREMYARLTHFFCFIDFQIENAESFFEQCTAEHLRLNFQAVVNQLKSDKYIIDSSLDRLLLDISYSDDSHDRAIAYNRRIFKNRKT